MYIYARYTRPASELNCLRFNLSELLILWQRTSCGNLQGNLFYDNPIQSMHSRWFQNFVIHLSITIWKMPEFWNVLLCSESWYPCLMRWVFWPIFRFRKWQFILFRKTARLVGVSHSTVQRYLRQSCHGDFRNLSKLKGLL